jgi:large subunit ribosomal protein L25
MPVLTARVRTDLGSAASRRLFAEGLIPAVLYGGAEVKPLHLLVKSAEVHTLLKAYYSEPGLLTLRVEGRGEFSVIIREIQHHPWKGFVRHLDFQTVEPFRIIRQSVEVLPEEGEAVRGVRLIRRKLLLRGPAEKLPHAFRVALSHLGEGQSILVRNLPVPENVQILDPPGEIVAVRQ